VHIITVRMDTTRIKKYLDHLLVKRSDGGRRLHHVGVYASDMLPTSLPQQSIAMVANTMPHTNSGEHWVVFYMDGSSGIIEYFDSFGRPPYQADFQKFLRRTCRRYVYNKQRLQGFTSTICGMYCLCFLYCRVHLNMSMCDFVQLFKYSNSADLENDFLLEVMFKSIYC